MINAVRIFSLLGIVFDILFIVISVYFFNDCNDLSIIENNKIFEGNLDEVRYSYIYYASVFLFIGTLGIVANIYSIIKVSFATMTNELHLAIILLFVFGNLISTLIMIKIRNKDLQCNV